MKKAVITIIMALPFVLIVIISIAGIILSEYTHISVEAVAFISEDGRVITKYTLGKDVESKLIVQVYPKLASNRQVKFSSGDENICTVDGEGKIKGIDYGTTIITVVTTEGRKAATLEVKVSDSPHPTSITLSSETLELNVKGSATLIANVLPLTAANKSVRWSSSDDNIATVDQNGKVTGVSEGEATITATTIENGLTASCAVTVTNEQVPLKWLDYEDGKGIYEVHTDTVDLFTLIIYDSAIISPDDIVFKVISGGANGTLNGSLLTFKNNNIIRLTVSANGIEAEILLRRSV